ncbi:hypothetical protein [Streptomyces triticirhizae]|uniref:Uncharacterized protein n=1 Tax=Streptomyces triticirhizae TaxID=2483353 RepID=A0A3M2MAV8_9ACTN|nr:hypothetical protein [Streptomyces triticirhizae]RMI46747.1 hypothetical protein EBN88_00510 [Streptomyces triticirhizae]
MPWSTIRFARTDTRVTAFGAYSSKASRALESVGFRRDTVTGEHYHPAHPKRQEAVIHRAVDTLVAAGITHFGITTSVDRLVSAIPTAEDVDELATLIEAVVNHEDQRFEEAIDAAYESLRRLNPGATQLLDDLEIISSRVSWATSDFLSVAEILRHPPADGLGSSRSQPPAPTPPSPHNPPNASTSRGR